jgi:hypothetical protein
MVTAGDWEARTAETRESWGGWATTTVCLSNMAVGANIGDKVRIVKLAPNPQSVRRNNGAKLALEAKNHRTQELAGAAGVASWKWPRPVECDAGKLERERWSDRSSIF